MYAHFSFQRVAVWLVMVPLLTGCGPTSDEIIDSMQFVTCPAGSFTMGHGPGELDGQPAELPQHVVTFASSYRIGTYEVTQEEWDAVLNDTFFRRWFPDDADQLPAKNVSWNKAQEFVDALNARRPGKNYRIPSEAEWEYACRAGTTTRFYWGEDLDRSAMTNYAWYDENSGGQSHLGGGKLPNAWGIHDMSGNQWEWTADVSHNSYDGAPTDGSAWVEAGIYEHVVRGGSWYNGTGCRSAFRGSMGPVNMYGDYGLRIAMDAPAR